MTFIPLLIIGGVRGGKGEGRDYTYHKFHPSPIPLLTSPILGEESNAKFLTIYRRGIRNKTHKSYRKKIVNDI